MLESPVSYWNRGAQEKRFSHLLRTDWLRKYLAHSAAILDYGCGYGRTLAQLTNAGYRNVIGTDFSPAMLRRCRTELPTLSLVQNDGASLPFGDCSLDAVLLIALLTCVPKDEDQIALIGEVKRVLRPGGLIYVSDFLVNEDSRNRERYERDAGIFGTYGVFELPEGVVVRHHAQVWIEELLGAYNSLEYAPFSAITMNGNRSAAFQCLAARHIT